MFKKMEKSTGVNILLMVSLSLFIPITMCLQNGGSRVSDGRIKSAGEEGKVRILAVTPFTDPAQRVHPKTKINYFELCKNSFPDVTWPSNTHYPVVIKRPSVRNMRVPTAERPASMNIRRINVTLNKACSNNLLQCFVPSMVSCLYTDSFSNFLDLDR